MKFTKRELILVGLLSCFVFMGFIQTRTSYSLFNYGIRITRQPSTLADVFLENEVDGVLNLATSNDSIGDLRPTGVHQTLFIPGRADTSSTAVPGALNDTKFFTQWMAAADSDNGIRFSQDIIIDSISFFATPLSSADSIISTMYNTTTNVTTVTTDTLIFSEAQWRTISLISGDGVTSGGQSGNSIVKTLRDFNISAGEFPAFHVTELGTLSTVGLLIHYRAFDVQ